MRIYNLTLKTIVFFGLLICTGCSPQAPKAKTDLPNIILLIGDDQGYPYFGFMGADYVHTPNMDALATSGTLFTNGYVSDNHCRPSLQTLLTGKLPIDYYRETGALFDTLVKANGIEEEVMEAYLKNFDQRSVHMQTFSTLPKLLSSLGYVSFQGGKWWEYNYAHGGFTHGMTKGWMEKEQKTKNWFIEHMGGEGMDLARVTNQPAYDFLEVTKGQPFFMWFAPSLPHYPFDAPEKYSRRYADENMTESAKQYYANCTWFDDAWGQMVDHLKKNDLYENTLIIYVNDNGWEQDPDQEFWNDPMRSHNGGDKGKGSIYDMSFRSPIIFSYPNKIPAGKRLDALIHSADIPATILDYVGLEIPKDYFGVSYQALLEGKIEQLRSRVYGNVITTRSDDPNNVMGDHVNGYWIREDQWFLRWHKTKNEVELFDVQVDPRNHHNVADENKQVVAKLMETLEQYRTEKGKDWRLKMYRSAEYDNH